MYPDRYATIRFEKSKSAAVFHISDRGKGFDAAAYLNADLANNHGFSGRGILTAKALSFDRLEYIGNGSQVSAMISFPEGADDPSTAD